MKRNKWAQQLEELRSYLTTKKCGCVIQYEYLVSSTQTIAHEWALSGALEGAVVIAEGQSNGRGRSGKQWLSPIGTGIWMSLILRPPIPVKDATHLTLLTAVAVKKGIQSIVHLPIHIKWPNDLLIHGKKICGILTEARSSRNQLSYMVIGIGINVNALQEDFPHELQGSATSLSIECGSEVSRTLLMASILHQMEYYYAEYLDRGFAPIKKEWEACSDILGKTIAVQTPNGKIIGEALRLTEIGELLIQTEQGIHAVNTPFIELS